jgi:Fe-S-cluster-containing hydrogenase component 2
MSGIGATPPRYRVTVDREQCMLCERCVESCPYGVFRTQDGRLLIDSRLTFP